MSFLTRSDTLRLSPDPYIYRLHTCKTNMRAAVCDCIYQIYKFHLSWFPPYLLKTKNKGQTQYLHPSDVSGCTHQRGKSSRYVSSSENVLQNKLRADQLFPYMRFPDLPAGIFNSGVLDNRTDSEKGNYRRTIIT